jgi:acyl-CoA thioesterase I
MSKSLLKKPFLSVLLVRYVLLAAFVNVCATSVAAEPVQILAFGDSLTAGYGLLREDAFPNKLARALAKDGISAEVVNAGVSGDTSSGGLSRLGWVLSSGDFDVAIVELGANDGLRGIDPDLTYANLDAILELLIKADIKVVLAGMKAPPNLGRDYTDRFSALYQRLAQRHDVIFYPFFLDDVAARAHLNQEDALHPNARGVDVIVVKILPFVKKAIKQATNEAQ